MHPVTDEVATLPEGLERAARRFPERGLALLDARGRETSRRTFPELLAALHEARGRWAALGVEPGRPVLVALSTSWAFLDAWLGALLHGALPVAVSPTGSVGGAEFHLRKLDAIAERLGAARVVSSATLREDVRAFGLGALAERMLTAEELGALTPRDAPLPRPDPEQPAFLQLTSGSTGLPRAVQIPHRAALHNSVAIDEAIGAPLDSPAHERTRSIVSWLPLNHDMGLVGCLFYAIHCGFDLWLLPPKAFLARPETWLRHLGEHGPSLAPAPNFAYQLCVERAVETAGLDLSPWRAAMTGAEMVRPETAAAFAERFGPAGFDAAAFRPCYGLAEATLAVTFDRRGGVRARPAPEDLRAGWGLTEVVSVGPPVADTEVAIVGPDGEPLPEGRIGEIRSRGPSTFTGYWNDPEATSSCLRDGWLCTGDLGFLQDGELHVTGRIKDVLIVHGNNLMPHEFEQVAESVSGGGGARRSAAFTVARGGEGEEVVLALEVEEGDGDALDALEREVRVRVGRTLSVPVADVVLVRRGRLPKTTSGKVQRGQVRADYVAGKLERVGRA